jgi:hypothetical protein
MSKRLKQLTHCLKRAESGVVLIVFICVLYEVHAYTVTVSNRLLYMNQVPEQKYILVSDRSEQTFIQSMQYKCSNRTSAG